MQKFHKQLPALLPALLFAVILPCFAYGQSAREAIQAVKQLKAHCDSGISYGDYPLGLADARLAVKRFAEGAEAARNPLLAMRLEGILEIYEEARLTWSLKFRKSSVPTDRFHRGGLLILTDEQDRAIWSAFLAAYPAAGQAIGAGGAMVDGRSVAIDRMVRMIWNRAARELMETESLLPGAGIKPKSEN